MDIVDDFAHSLQAPPTSACYVGCKFDIVEIEQRVVVRDGFGIVDIKDGGGIGMVGEEVGCGCGIDDHATGGVEEEYAVFHV